MRTARRLLPLLYLLTGCAASAHAQRIERVRLPCGARLLLRSEPQAGAATIVLIAPTKEGSTPDIGIGRLVGDVLLSRIYIAPSGSPALKISGDASVAPTFAALTLTVPSEQAVPLAQRLASALEAGPPSAIEITAAAHHLRSDEGRIQSQFEIAWQSALRPTGAPMPDRYAPEPSFEDVTRFWNACFAPNRLVVSVAGGFNSDEVSSVLTASLGRLEYKPSQQEAAEPNRPSLDETNLSGPGFAAYAFVAVEGPALSDADLPAFWVMSTLLGGGHASRLFVNIRDARGIGYLVGTRYRPDRGEPLVAYLQWDPDLKREGGSKLTPAQAKDLLIREMNALAAAPPALPEVQRAVALAVGQYTVQQELLRRRAFWPALFEAVGSGYAKAMDLPARLQAVTAQDIQRVAAKYLGKRRTTLVLPFPSGEERIPRL